MKIKIIDDLFDIAWRVKAINDVYEIFYDTVKHRFEIFAEGRLELIVPYKTLDARTVDLVNKTRIENIEKLISQSDKHNEWLEQNREKKLKDVTSYKARQLTDYLMHGGTDIPSYDNI